MKWLSADLIPLLMDAFNRHPSTTTLMVRLSSAVRVCGFACLILYTASDVPLFRRMYQIAIMSEPS